MYSGPEGIVANTNKEFITIMNFSIVILGGGRGLSTV